MSSPLVSAIVSGLLLALIQFIFALPWLALVEPTTGNIWTRLTRGRTRVGPLADPNGSFLNILLTFLGIGVGIGFLIYYVKDPERLSAIGRYYGMILHLQMIAAFLILFFVVLLKIWPKGGAVALASFREGVRSSMFWFMLGGVSAALMFFMVIPYFTFGQEYDMMSSLGFETIMLIGSLFAVLTASVSIYEDIEGRTAITVISKPINRRQFLLGKFLGILIAALTLTLLLGWVLNWSLNIKPYFDNKLDEITDYLANQSRTLFAPVATKIALGVESQAFARGALDWLGEGMARVLGLMLGFGQVTVLLAIASALAIRLPMVVNIVVVLVVYLLGHLAPVLVRYSAALGNEAGGATKLIGFLSQVLNITLPDLGYFSMSPAIIRDIPIDLGGFSVYVGQVAIYALMYSGIALLLGLILFEDRDLA